MIPRQSRESLFSLNALYLCVRHNSIITYTFCVHFSAGHTLGTLCRGSISLLCVNAVQVEWTESLAVPLLNALYLCVRHNAAAPTISSHHSNDYKGIS